MARLVFLGTPDLAVVPLRALVDAGHSIELVVSRPDRRRGRGAALSPSPVKAAALDLGLPVSDRVAEAADVGAELGVVVAYGRLVPAAVLEAVPMVNLHFSLLPRWRGAAPVERAILAGDAETGVCVMALEATLDTGPIYARRAVPIGPDEHLGALRSRLVQVGVELLLAVVAGGAAGLPPAEPQTGEATYAEKIDPGLFELDFARPSPELARIVRLDRAWTTFRGRRLAVVEARAEPWADGGEPGRLVGDRVVTGQGALHLEVVQPEGRRPQAAADWLRGARPAADERLGA